MSRFIPKSQITACKLYTFLKNCGVGTDDLVVIFCSHSAILQSEKIPKTGLNRVKETSLLVFYKASLLLASHRALNQRQLSSDRNPYNLIVCFKATLGSIPELPAQSCQEIKASEGKDTISSKYWLDPSGTAAAALVYCDMNLEG